MNTPVMLTSTAIILITFNESSPRNAPKNNVNRPDVEDRIVVLATLVLARAALDRYCMKKAMHVRLWPQQYQVSNMAAYITPYLIRHYFLSGIHMTMGTFSMYVIWHISFSVASQCVDNMVFASIVFSFLFHISLIICMPHINNLSNMATYISVVAINVFLKYPAQWWYCKLIKTFNISFLNLIS